MEETPRVKPKKPTAGIVVHISFHLYSIVHFDISFVILLVFSYRLLLFIIKKN